MKKPCCIALRPASLLILVLSGLTFIQPLRAMAGAGPETNLQLVLHLDKNAYRPGEAVLVEVNLSVACGTRAIPKVRALNAGSVLFYFGRRGEPERMERQAVVSTREDLNTLMTLMPGQAGKRAFILTRLTEFNGPMVLQAHYLPGDAAAEAPRIYSNTVEFQVGGEPLFRRDPAGLMIKADAVRLACAALGGETEQARAIFILDEAGFYKWYVNVKPRGGALAGVLIDPYRGAIWHKARPFEPALAADPRLQRPAGLPAAQIPARAPRP